MHIRAGKSVRFQFVEGRITLVHTADWVRQRLPTSFVPTTAAIKLTTPCHAPSLDIRDLVGNMAASLTKLEHTLRNDPMATKRGIDDDADAARDAARASFVDVVEISRHILHGPRGERASGETGHRIPLRGVHGTILLGGDLREALPWLALAELHGLGQHTAFGMGQVQISWHGIKNDRAVSQSP